MSLTQTSEKSKRIANNTGAIYIRMIVVMLVTLYTSRVVLQQLGVIDFGINNVVAGIVSLLAFFSSSLSNAAQRYLSIGLGEHNTPKTRLYFRQSFSLMVIFSVAIFVLAETVGLWMVYTQLSIPASRLDAAVWAYHFAVVSVVCSILQVPFLAAIIANERMKMYAYIGLFESFARLVIAFLLAIGNCDKLILFSALSATVSILTLMSYILYDRISFQECRISWIWQSNLVKEMLRFIGYTMFGCLAWSVSNQGMNIVLNIFFGPAINAARAIALQVSATIDRFSSSLITAAAPQIIKSYAEKDINYMTSIIEKVSKFSFFLACTMAVPIIWETEYILHIWLGQVPDYTVVFTRLLVVDSLINIFFQPLSTAANATGRIKNIQIYGRFITLAALPIGYIALSYSANPLLAIFAIIATDLAFCGYCLIDIHKQIDLNIAHYIRHSVCPPLILLVTSMTVCWIMRTYTDLDGFMRFVLTSATSILSCLATALLLLSPSERNYLKSFIHKK